MKKFIKFLIFLLPWFFSGILFCNSNTFYSELELPFFALPSFYFTIIWTILYILISISIYLIYNKYQFNSILSYNKALLSNYLFNQSFCLLFFTLQSTFLGFVSTLFTFVTSLFLYYETEYLDKKASYFLIPYVFFNIFALILSLTIYFMNF